MGNSKTIKRDDKKDLTVTHLVRGQNDKRVSFTPLVQKPWNGDGVRAKSGTGARCLL